MTEETEVNSLWNMHSIPENAFRDAFYNWEKLLEAVYSQWRRVL
jgi:hypothetical protein